MRTTAPAGVSAIGLAKRYGAVEALRHVDLEVRPGELLALLGPSGSGKTTLLRVLAGLETVDAGQLILNGRDAGSLRPGERGVGLVFQNYALFRHMSVFDNVAFGLTVRRPRPARALIASRVEELLSLVQLEGYARRRPGQLSGGQRQRVALARALAADPTLLLLDEPFGALDRMVRVDLRLWLRDLQQRLGITTVLVTHDQEEASEMADRVAVFRAGSIEQIGPPEELRTRPATPFVREFLGYEASRSRSQAS